MLTGPRITVLYTLVSLKLTESKLYDATVNMARHCNLNDTVAHSIPASQICSAHNFKQCRHNMPILNKVSRLLSCMEKLAGSVGLYVVPSKMKQLTIRGINTYNLVQYNESIGAEM